MFDKLLNIFTSLFLFLLIIVFNISCLLNKKSVSIEFSCEKIKEGALIIDTRSPGEYAKRHLENAINIPHTEIKERLCEISDDKKQLIILYCLTGHRSHYVQKVLKEQGYENVHNSGAYRKLRKCK